MPEAILRCCKCRGPLRSNIYGSYCEDCWADRAGNLDYPLSSLMRPKTNPPPQPEEPKGFDADD
jgi:hypothetical protein